MLSPSQKLALAISTLQRGSVCHWQQPFGPHYAVILNKDWPPPDGFVYFSIMTSNVAAFPSSIQGEVITTGPADYSFLTKPTVINLRQVLVAKVSDVVGQTAFGIKGNLTPDHLLQADEILRKSMTVEEEFLEKVRL